LTQNSSLLKQRLVKR